MTAERAGARPTTIHLVPHTHWDREWYRPFQSFRMQLVDLVDRVLEMLEAEPDFAFTLDGQLATVDDYLEIRPEQEERLRGHVQSGRLAIGPWQILMDEFLVSGETLVRNLEMGWERADEFGGPMRIGYLPDMFGHVAQMPQLLRAAGLADAVVWRGIPGSIDRHAFRWESPDGSWVRAEYLPSGYGNAASMFAVPDGLKAASERFLEWSDRWFGADPVLAMYGTDHAAPVPELAALVSRLNEVQDASSMRIGTLAQYVAAAPPLTESDPCWRGEMRSGARANVLMGVASARIDIKQAAGRAERWVERYAEPLTALHVAVRCLAGSLPAPRVAEDDRELGARLDLRVQYRPCRGPGPRPLRRGRADRLHAGTPGGSHGRRRSRAGGHSGSQSLADAPTGRRRGRGAGPRGVERGRARAS